MRTCHVQAQRHAALAHCYALGALREFESRVFRHDARDRSSAPSRRVWLQ